MDLECSNQFRIVDKSKVETIFIDAMNGVDPITVYLEDIGIAQGRLTIVCYGSAWSTYWGAMGNGLTIKQFVNVVGIDYIISNLLTMTNHGHLKVSLQNREQKYLQKIVSNVKTILAGMVK